MAQTIVPKGVQDRLKLIFEEASSYNSGGLAVSQIECLYNDRYDTKITADSFSFSTWDDLLKSSGFEEFCEVFYCTATSRSKVRPKVPLQQIPPNDSMMFDDITIKAPSTPISSPRPSSRNDPMDLDMSPSISLPSGNSSILSSTSSSRRLPPPAPSWSETGSVKSGSSRMGDDATSNSSSKRMKTSEPSLISSWAPSEVSVRSLAPQEKMKLKMEQGNVQWMERDNSYHEFTFDELILDRRLGIQEPVQFVDTTFCERGVLQKLMDIKHTIKQQNTDNFLKIRKKLNEFEESESMVFYHGAALKFANIDALLGYSLTAPKEKNGDNMIGHNELLYFVDILGGPGGYVEYMLYKKKWDAKGFGFCPKEWEEYSAYNLKPRLHYPCESFEPYYDLSGEANIFDPDCIERFVKHVLRSTYHRGAHICVADGGEKDYSGDEDQKEIRCKSMFLAEMVIGLKVLREGGHFVIKMYDILTTFSAGLVYLLYRCFDDVAIYKPETATMASSERYIICKGRRRYRNVSEVVNYLVDCSRVEWNSSKIKHKQEKAEIVEIVPLQTLKQSWRFFEYLRAANRSHGLVQLREIDMVLKSIRGQSSTRDATNRIQAIITKAKTLWGIPEIARSSQRLSGGNETVRATKLLRPYKESILETFCRLGEVKLTKSVFNAEIVKPKDWNFCFVGKERGFFLSLGRNGNGKAEIYRYDGKKWVEIEDRIELANNTIVYADMVDEQKLQEEKTIIVTGFHIIDALVLGGKDVRKLPYNERMEQATKFAASMNKSSHNDKATIRTKKIRELTKMNHGLESLTQISIRIVGRKYTVKCDEEERFSPIFVPTGCLFVKSRKEDSGAEGDFSYAMHNLLFWDWTDVDLDQTKKAPALKPNLLHASTMLEMIKAVDKPVIPGNTLALGSSAALLPPKAPPRRN